MSTPSSPVPYLYNNVAILCRGDGYWSATAMCQATGKLWGHYFANKTTQEFLAALSRSIGIPIDLLVQVKADGPNILRGTWVHRRVAIHLAQWCNPDFAVQVSAWVEDLLTKGRVEIQPPQSRPWSLRVSRSIVAHRIQITDRHGAGFWSVYTATTTEMMIMEDAFLDHCLPLKKGDLPDGSIGMRWANHRRANGLTGPAWRDCPLSMPHLGIEVFPWVYCFDELVDFQEWLNENYLPKYLPEYLGVKFADLGADLAVASAANNACHQLTGRQAQLPGPARQQIQAAGGIVRVGDDSRLLPASQRELFQEEG